MSRKYAFAILSLKCHEENHVTDQDIARKMALVAGLVTVHEARRAQVRVGVYIAVGSDHVREAYREVERHGTITGRGDARIGLDLGHALQISAAIMGHIPVHRVLADQVFKDLMVVGV